MTKKDKAAWAGPVVGQDVFIRTVTYFYVGEVTGVTADWIHLTGAAWVADTGRFAQALATGVMHEVEPYPPPGEVSVARGAIVDVSPWAHALLRTTQ